jgi:ArsR family transcriptional regulator, arsenate/arsenite/antimonite-responsive transcriptional repressor
MGNIEKNKFSEDGIQLARFTKALGHPARIEIIKFLASHESCFCGNIVDYLPLSQSTVSQHLKELKEAGLIYDRIVQPKVYYCINKENWFAAKKLLEDFLKINVNQYCE